MDTEGLGVRRTREQLELDATNRRRTLVGVLVAARDADDLVLLAGMLELGEELSDLVAGDLERHRRLAEAQDRLDQPIEELEELAASRAERH